MNKKLLIMLSPPFMFSGEDLQRISDTAKEYEVIAVPAKEATKEQMVSSEIIFGWPDTGLLKEAKTLKWLHLPSAGVDGYRDKNIYARADLMLTTSGGTFGKPMAEHAIGLILAFNRNIHLYARDSDQARWIKHLPVRDFFGSTVGIVGLGDIGRETAMRCKAMGARVLAVKRTPGEKHDYVDELYMEKDIDILLKESDSIVMALPATEKTKGFLSKERIGKMKQTAFIVNLGRGSAIDQNALIEALKENRLAGAGLDVTDPEPLPADNPLWTMPNVIMTSHSSGLSPTSIQRNFDIFARNLEKFLANEPLNNLVDFNEGY